MLKEKRGLVFSILASAGLIIYWPGLQGSYYADDFKFVFDEPSSKIFYFFGHQNPNLSMYRPLQSLILAIIQSMVGVDTLPIHLLTLCLHVLLAWFVYVAALRLKFTILQAVLSSAFMLFSQANAMAVLGNDTLSQVAGTLFGFLSLWYFYQAQHRPLRSSYMLSVLFFALSLWFKETSLTFLLSLSLIALAIGPRLQHLRNAVFVLLPYYLIGGFFILVRLFVISTQPADRYDIVLGLNNLNNAAMSFFSAVVPVSSVSAYAEFVQSDHFSFFLTLLLSIVFTLVIVMGILKLGTSPIVRLLILVAVVNLLPLALLRHVSELYTYNSMPALALLFGFGAVGFSAMVQQRRLTTIVAVALFILLFGSHGYAVHKKAQLAAANGQKATALIEEIRPFLDQVPRNGTLVLLNPMTSKVEYSVFLMEGFDVLNYGTNIFRQISRREDIHILISKEGSSFAPPPNSIVLTLSGGKVTTWKES